MNRQPTPDVLTFAIATGSHVIGFCTYHYKSASGQEGDWFPVGFAFRKAAITVYLERAR
jgi:hypothetical protein